MPNEDIEIRITKNGEIFVRIEGASEERVRDYIAFLEEMVGPVRSIQKVDRPEWERPVSRSTETDEDVKDEQELGH